MQTDTFLGLLTLCRTLFWEKRGHRQKGVTRDESYVRSRTFKCHLFLQPKLLRPRLSRRAESGGRGPLSPPVERKNLIETGTAAKSAAMWATIQSAITIGWAKNDKGKEDAGERLEIPMAFAFYSHIQNMAPSKKPAPHV